MTIFTFSMGLIFFWLCSFFRLDLGVHRAGQGVHVQGRGPQGHGGSERHSPTKRLDSLSKLFCAGERTFIIFASPFTRIVV